MPLGTSMDYESLDSRSKGCWDPAANLMAFYEKWSTPSATPDFVVDDVWCGLVGGIGFGATATAEKSAFWTQTLKKYTRVTRAGRRFEWRSTAYWRGTGSCSGSGILNVLFTGYR
jgi:hypothetical protein